jgi:hypothetical protein
MQVMTAFYPEANGAVERFHWQLKDSLWAGLDRLDWLEHLSWILLGLRAAPREDFGVSAALFLQGSSSRSPSRHLPPSYSNLAHPFLGVGQDKQRPATADYGPALQAATNVYVRLPPVLPVLSPANHRPYRMWVLGAKYFILKVGGRPQSILADNLKPNLGASPVSATLTPRHSRPAKKRNS